MLVQVNVERCDEVAKVLLASQIPADTEDSRPAGFDDGELSNLYLLLVAICHQTQDLAGVVSGKSCRGWDYLSQRFQESSQSDRSQLDPKRWATISGSDLTAVFGPTLSLADERAALVRNIGEVMSALGHSRFLEFGQSCEGRIASGCPNLLAMLGRFQAFNDPVKKKAFFLLGLMSNSSLWNYSDQANLGAPVDYHEVRGHLRLGTVTVADDSLRAKILNRVAVTIDEDVAIRTAVFDAIVRIASTPSLPNPMTLHYLFWNIFRQVCNRDTPHCREVPAELPLPERYRHLLTAVSQSPACPFNTICDHANQRAPQYIEHSFTGDWY